MRINIVGVALCVCGALVGGNASLAAEPETVFGRIGPIDVLGSGSDTLEVAAGVFNVTGEGGGDEAAAAQIEYRFGRKLYFVGPAIGVLANSDGGVFGYGGIFADLAWGRIVVTPLLSLGAYSKGDGRDLGGTFQFRSALGISYRFAGGSRLGLRLAHISNAGINGSNPGEEEVLVSYSVPLGPLF